MLDITHEQTDARVRLSAAVIAAGAALWLAWVETSVWLRIAALVGLLFAARFVASYRKVRRVAQTASAHYLEITTERVTLADGAGERSMPFDRVTRIELDEDRIAVVLRAGEAEELSVEPLYGGLGLRELAATLHRYHQAHAGLGCTERNP
jgi:predicted RNA-binding protein